MIDSGEIPYSLDKYDILPFTTDDKIAAETRIREREYERGKIVNMCRELIPSILKRNIL